MSQCIIIIIIIVVTAVAALTIMWIELTFIEHLLYAWYDEKRFMCIILLHNLTKIFQLLNSGAKREIQSFWFQNLCYLLECLFMLPFPKKTFYPKTILNLTYRDTSNAVRLLMPPIKMNLFNTFKYVYLIYIYICLIYIWSLMTIPKSSGH